MQARLIRTADSHLDLLAVSDRVTSRPSEIYCLISDAMGFVCVMGAIFEDMHDRQSVSRHSELPRPLLQLIELGTIYLMIDYTQN